MAGFLDRDTRVLDMVFTNPGKELLSKGRLNFCYWVPFDDGIDYAPFISNSGSLTAEALSASIDLSIETTPMREVTTGYRVCNMSGTDNTNVNLPLFDRPQGLKVVPRTVMPPVPATRNIHTTQRQVIQTYKDRDERGNYTVTIKSVDMGIERFGSTSLPFELYYGKGSFTPDSKPEGFRLRVYRSGSGGMVEVPPKRDLQNNLCFGSDIRIIVRKA